jgi:hypothetical protein
MLVTACLHLAVFVVACAVRSVIHMGSSSAQCNSRMHEAYYLLSNATVLLADATSVHDSKQEYQYVVTLPLI